MRTPLETARRIVVKVGTGVVTGDHGRLALGRLGGLVEEVVGLRADGREVVLVSSGAVGLGAGRLGYDAVPTGVVDRQACAAAGQGALIGIYDRLLSELGYTVAQLLLTEGDFLDRTRYLHLHATLEHLLSRGAIPVVNENDTVSIHELVQGRDKVFGDNDRLSALVAAGIGADLLVLLTDVDGVYTAPPGTPNATRISTWDNEEVALGARSALGRGGMGAKIAAAQMAQHTGAHVVVANASDAGILRRVCRGDDVGTWFPATDGLSRRGRWLGYATAPTGRICVDAGAKRAVAEGRKSLLPAGIVSVTGAFEAGAVVSLVGPDGTEFARGLCARSADDVRAVVGRTGGQRAVVHRDNVVVLRTLEEG